MKVQYIVFKLSFSRYQSKQCFGARHEHGLRQCQRHHLRETDARSTFSTSICLWPRISHFLRHLPKNYKQCRVCAAGLGKHASDSITHVGSSVSHSSAALLCVLSSD